MTNPNIEKPTLPSPYAPRTEGEQRLFLDSQEAAQKQAEQVAETVRIQKIGGEVVEVSRILVTPEEDTDGGLVLVDETGEKVYAASPGSSEESEV